MCSEAEHFEEEGDTINACMNGAERSVFFVFIEFSDKFGTECRI